jgi:hypothetical protein
VRELAAAHGEKYQTVAPYLAAADAVTPEVLAAAGLAGADGEPQRQGCTGSVTALSPARQVQNVGPMSATAF